MTVMSRPLEACYLDVHIFLRYFWMACLIRSHPEQTISHLFTSLLIFDYIWRWCHVSFRNHKEWTTRQYSLLLMTQYCSILCPHTCEAITPVKQLFLYILEGPSPLGNDLNSSSDFFLSGRNCIRIGNSSNNYCCLNYFKERMRSKDRFLDITPTYNYMHFLKHYPVADI